MRWVGTKTWKLIGQFVRPIKMFDIQFQNTLSTVLHPVSNKIQYATSKQQKFRSSLYPDSPTLRHNKDGNENH